MAIIKLRDINNDYLEGFLEEKNGCATTETDENLGCPATNLQQNNGCPATENMVVPQPNGCSTTEKSNENGCSTIRLTGCSTTEKTDEKVVAQPQKVVAQPRKGCSTTNKSKQINQWRKENRDTLRIDLPKGSKATLQAVARDKGVSVSSLVRDALSIYLD